MGERTRISGDISRGDTAIIEVGTRGLVVVGATRQWAQLAFDELHVGRAVQVRPRGHSMTGRISDGDLVTLAPCIAEDLAASDIVLARVKGRRFFHLVLHEIHERDDEQFLIGSATGRLDGWIGFDDIFGKVIEVVVSENF